MRLLTGLAVMAVLLTMVWLAGCGGDTADTSARSGGQERGSGQGQGRGQGQGQGQGQQRSPEEWLQRTRENVAEAKVTMEAAIAQAAAAAKGKVTGIRLMEGTNGPEYAIDVLADTGMLSVRIDAVTDSILSIGPSRRGGNRGGRPEGQGQGQDRGYSGNRGGGQDHGAGHAD